MGVLLLGFGAAATSSDVRVFKDLFQPQATLSPDDQSLASYLEPVIPDPQGQAAGDVGASEGTQVSPGDLAVQNELPSKGAGREQVTASAIYAPERIVIPAINLDAPIIKAKSHLIKYQGYLFKQWLAPDEFAAGWQSSATLGKPGNVVLNGHHNEYGEVFGGLVDLEVGDTIQVYSGSRVFNYEIANKMILPERDQPLSVRLANAQWIEPSTDERLTLITCWPKDNNTHRLIIVAVPIQSAGG